MNDNKYFLNAIICLFLFPLAVLPDIVNNQIGNADKQEHEMNKFIDRLMSKMTVREKIGQINMVHPWGEYDTGPKNKEDIYELARNGELGVALNLVGADKVHRLQQIAVNESRLGIPIFSSMDVIHGFRTIFPIPLAQSCSWDIPAIENAARIAAEEASADGISWTFSPMADIALDARWGRVMEGNGEDPFLGSAIAEAMVRGYQGNIHYNKAFDIKPPSILACVKHFALYGAVEAGREYNTVDMSHWRMFNQYFPTYKAAIEAGAASVMTSFNIVDGLQATMNPWLISDVLRHKWGFKGFVVTDNTCIAEIVNHGFGDTPHNAALALKAGTDLDMGSLAFLTTLEKSLKDGNVNIEDINKACRTILEAKYRLGLFKDPYRYCNTTAVQRDSIIFSNKHRKVAENLAAETFVLLKNDTIKAPSLFAQPSTLLPLPRHGSIALIGPLADCRQNLTGAWCWPVPDKYYYPSLREVMEATLDGKAELNYTQGCNLCSDSMLQVATEDTYIPRLNNDSLNEVAMDIARKADVIVCAMGESKGFSGEDKCRTNLEMPDTQMNLLKKLSALGKPIVLLNFSGRPTVMTWENSHIPAILNVWFGGTEAAQAICDVLFGKKTPSGHLTVSMPRETGQVPLYYNQLPTGRPVKDNAKQFELWKSNYIDVRNDALFPFGFGLSYTTFKYHPMQIEVSGANVNIKVEVENTGERDGWEVVQCYIHDIACRYSRPIKELKGFRRVFIPRGGKQEITFQLTKKELGSYDADGNFFFEPGYFDIMVGANSRDVEVKRINIK